MKSYASPRVTSGHQGPRAASGVAADTVGVAGLAAAGLGHIERPLRVVGSRGHCCRNCRRGARVAHLNNPLTG